MKKLLVLLLSVSLLAGCTAKINQDSTNSIQKIDVSTLNILDLNATTADMSDYTLLTDTQHVFKQITMEESLRLFDEKGSGVLFYGYKQCGFCQQAVPVLNNAARQMGVDVYYVDVKSQEGNSSEIFEQLINRVEDHLAEENGQKMFYVPQIFVIKDGEIVGEHLSLIDSYDINSGDMNEKQRNDLKKIYVQEIDKLR